MHRSIGAVVMALLMVASGATLGIGAVAAQQSGASATITEQTSGGHTVVVNEVRVPNGGFVTIHDSTVNEGGSKTFTSVRGTSAYLTPGTHENVTVHIDDPLEEDRTFVAMAHRDTNGDRIYSFVATSGGQDGPYTKDGGAVIDSAPITVSATVSMSDQPTSGSSVVVDRVELSEGGFVTVHDSSLLDGAVFDSVLGSSKYLKPGVHEDVRVQFEEDINESDTLIPMAHKDTNDNQAYDFVSSEGSNDGPFLNKDDSEVIDTASATVQNKASVGMNDTETGGHFVSVDSAYLPNGGFVTIHDSTLLDGSTFDSVRGTSEYLEPGLHRDVHVRLDEPLAEDDTVIPMAHRDTNDNEAYDFVSGEGQNDGPYTKDGGAVIDTANATVSAAVSMSDMESNGNTVTVHHVDLSEGGFVTIHDASLLGGATFDSVRGTSKYLEAGFHSDVEIALDEPMKTSQIAIPMAHKDTNGNEAYDFVSGEGGNDGPYVAGGGAVIDTAHTSVLAQVTFEGQTDVSGSVTVESVTLHDGGFVTVHDSSLLDGAVFDSVRGTSEYLGPGTHENVEVEIDRVPGGEDTLVAMPHYDTNGNENYDFVSSDGAQDGPYTVAGSANVAPAMVTAESTPTPEPMDGGSQTDASDGSGAGFGAVVALVAILGGVLAARRLH